MEEAAKILCIDRADLIQLLNFGGESGASILEILCNPLMPHRHSIDYPQLGDIVLTPTGTRMIRDTHDCDWVEVIFKKGETNGTERR